MIKYIILALMLLISPLCAQQDIITSLDNDGLPSINEELRKLKQQIDSKYMTLQASVNSLETTINNLGIKHYIKGFELQYNSSTVVSVLAGTLEIDNVFYSDNETNTVNISSASDGWVYIYTYSDNEGSLLYTYSANAPNKSDTSGTTTGILRYYLNGSTYWRCLGAVYKSSGSIIQFIQQGNYIEFTTFQVIKSSYQITLASVACLMPSIAQVGNFNLYHIVGSGSGLHWVEIYKDGGSSVLLTRIADTTNTVGTKYGTNFVCYPTSQTLYYITKNQAIGAGGAIELKQIGYWINIRD